MPNCNGLLHLISLPPPGWRLTFSSYPWRLTKIAFTPEDFRKIWAYRWRIWVLAPKNLVLPLKNFAKIKASPPNNYVFFTLPLKKSSIFITYPWRIPWFLIRVGGGGGMRILNAIAQSDSIFFKFVHNVFAWICCQCYLYTLHVLLTFSAVILKSHTQFGGSSRCLNFDKFRATAPFLAVRASFWSKK